MQQNNDVIAKLGRASKRYGDLLALDAVNLDVRRGEVLALLGPNGAGKTTAISLLLGLLQADSGSATLFGEAPKRLSARRRIGAMLQTTGVPETLTIGELISLFRSYYARPRTVADIVALAGVDDLLKRRYGKLSGGQQRRAQFALAICGMSEILFLDEPTTGLDIEARETMWKTIRQLVGEGCAIVLTTHYLEEAEALADRVSVLARGRIVAEGSVQHDPCACRPAAYSLHLDAGLRPRSRTGPRCAASRAMASTSRSSPMPPKPSCVNCCSRTRV